MLYKGGVRREVLLLAVLEDKETFGLQYVAREHEVWQRFQLRQCVGRVGKDEVELLAALGQKSENVGS